MLWIGLNLAVAPYSWCIIDESGRIVVSQGKDSVYFSSENIIDELENALNLVEKKLSDIGYIAWVSGPGNYTGLRMSATAINFLSQILNVKLIPVSSFEWIGQHVCSFDGCYLGVTPGVKGQVNTQLIGVNAGVVSTQSELVAMTETEFEAFLKKFKVPFKLVGVFPPSFSKIAEEFPMIQRIEIEPDARHAVKLALNRPQDIQNLVLPVYFHHAVKPK